VLADWFDECGDGERARFLRLTSAVRTCGADVAIRRPLVAEYRECVRRLGSDAVAELAPIQPRHCIGAWLDPDHPVTLAFDRPASEGAEPGKLHRIIEELVRFHADFLRDCDPMDSLLLVTNRVVRVDVWTGAITWIWYEGVFVPVVQRAKDQLRSRGAEWLKSA